MDNYIYIANNYKPANQETWAKQTSQNKADSIKAFLKDVKF